MEQEPNHQAGVATAEKDCRERTGMKLTGHTAIAPAKGAVLTELVNSRIPSRTLAGVALATPRGACGGVRLVRSIPP
jgi:hypothetical protein